MSAALDRSQIETQEEAKTEEVARLAQTVEALESRLEAVKVELAQAVGGLTTLRGILGVPITGAPPEPNGAKPQAKPKRSRRK